jgi:hypothetical protein
MLKQIAALGPPAVYVPKVTAFLEALKRRLDEVREEPKKLTSTPFPFARAAKAAAAAGLEGCAGSFS